MTAPVQLRDGDTLLAVVKDGQVTVHSWDIALSHAEFVRRTLGELPRGAWVGTIRKANGEVMPLNSRTFYGNQLPAPQAVLDAVRAILMDTNVLGRLANLCEVKALQKNSASCPAVPISFVISMEGGPQGAVRCQAAHAKGPCT
jgi:hypothetical protein